MQDLGAERWQRMWSILDQAMSLSSDQRGAFLESSCDDPLLRDMVEKMLEVDASHSGFLKQPMFEVPGEDQDFTSEPVRRDNDRIGPYRLQRCIGQGGMGTVYLAIRDDDTFQRRVVVKLARFGMENAEALRRLRTERQILASLDHPYVAELYDGGSTEDQLPYFVMEYVEGVPIDTFCDTNQLSIDERLTLFRKVCSAVHYAHQNLVVHRDLKPSNILVTADGEPKLLDFGIAKLLNPELSPSPLESTATWQRLLTPQYASPEQVRGKLVTTASDVFSLGVLLYKLLTGQLPHRFSERSPSEIERVLTEREPTRPSLTVAVGLPSEDGQEGAEANADEISRSRRTTPRELRRLLTGDLDSIVLKALRSTPPQRYGSVEQLAADIERYQNGLVVLARQGTWRYRTVKFLRRNRTLLVASAAGLMLLMAFVAAMAWQSARVAHERDQARLEGEKKESVLALLLDVFGLNDPTLNDRDKAGMTVGEALARSGLLLDRRLRGQPEVRAEILHVTGTIYLHLGLHRRAREQLQQAWEIRRALLGDEARETARTLSVLSRALHHQGELDTAVDYSQRSVSALRRSGEATRADLVASLNRLVAVLCQQGEYDAAEPLAAEALTFARELPGQDQELAFAINGLAAVRTARGEYEKAVVLYRQSVAVLETLWGEDHVALMPPLNNLGLALRHLEDFAAAEEAYERNLAILREALGDDHPDLAASLNNLGGVLFAKGDYTGALSRYRESLRIVHDSFGPDHRLVLLVSLRVDATRVRLGHLEEAESDLRRQLAHWRPKLAEDDWMLALGDSILGEALTAQGRYDEAEPLLTQSFLTLLQQSKHRRKREALDRLVAFYETRGEPQQIARYEAMLASE